MSNITRDSGPLLTYDGAIGGGGGTGIVILGYNGDICSSVNANRTIVFTGPDGKQAKLFWKNNQLCFEGDIETGAKELFKFLSDSWGLRVIQDQRR
jgi:hypothetical protein